jgi:hypothetical protein
LGTQPKNSPPHFTLTGLRTAKIDITESKIVNSIDERN